VAVPILLTVHAGRDKHGRPEPYETLEIAAGETVAIVGATGSGKTRLLADIERLSPGDSPSGRRVTLAGVPDAVVQDGFAVARITQSMQFFLDLSAADFVAMHLQARGTAGRVDLSAVVAQANRLAGEPFDAATPLASLSGGQARALMIADVLGIGDAPVLLIDEIENAGIDRHAALDVLGGADRLVFLATHDPLLALRADARMVLGGGAVRAVIATTPGERRLAGSLARADRRTRALRDALRQGETLA
jgi:ABC-type lipoprotein export system ATPase subunit